MDKSHFIYLFISQLTLNGFHFLVIINNTAMNTDVHILCVGALFSFILVIYLLKELLDHMVTLHLTFRGTSGLYYKGADPHL